MDKQLSMASAGPWPRLSESEEVTGGEKIKVAKGENGLRPKVSKGKSGMFSMVQVYRSRTGFRNPWMKSMSGHTVPRIQVSVLEGEKDAGCMADIVGPRKDRISATCLVGIRWRLAAAAATETWHTSGPLEEATCF